MGCSVPAASSPSDSVAASKTSGADGNPAGCLAPGSGRAAGDGLRSNRAAPRSSLGRLAGPVRCCEIAWIGWAGRCSGEGSPNADLSPEASPIPSPPCRPLEWSHWYHPRLDELEWRGIHRIPRELLLFWSVA